MINKILTRGQDIVSLLRNVYRLRRVSLMECCTDNGVTYRGFRRDDFEQVAQIYTELNNGAVFSKWLGWLYRAVGGRCLLVAVKNGCDGGGRIVGINMYYLNLRDLREDTVHEGFIGVNPADSGRGIATRMRILSRKHFELAKFKGISTRISRNNIASLHSAEKLGFEIVDEYFDLSNDDIRYYMTCKF